MQNRSDTEQVTRGTDAQNMHFARKVLIYPILLEHLLSLTTLISFYLFDFFATPFFLFHCKEECNIRNQKKNFN